MLYLLIASTTVFILLARWLSLITHNYQQARSIGLPILLTPIDAMHPIWILLNSYLVPVLKVLPFGLGSWERYTSFGWSWPLKYSMHEKYGEAFMIVGPGKNIVVVAEAQAADEISTRRKDFVKSKEMYGPLEIFGPNLDTVEGETWQRHRRLTVPPFNERNSNLVWQESLRQASDMLKSWTGGDSVEEGVSTLSRDTGVLALHVLTAAGFGKQYPFSGGLQELLEGYSMTYKDAMATILSNLFTTILAFKISIPAWIAPQRFTKVTEAIDNFKRYMVERVEEERTAILQKVVESDNLLSVLVRASESFETGANARSGLSDEELYGNLFIYSFAGHETTANTLAYAIALLSTDLQCQEWLREEITQVLGNDDVETWQYEDTFPRFKRCLAVMYETLRLYGPVFFIPRYTDTSPTQLHLCSQLRTIPPHTYVYIDGIALHTAPQHWGLDALQWKPQRWLLAGKEEGGAFLQPAPGSFMPWAGGPRVCPGKKFSQVEFVSVLAVLFGRYRVRPFVSASERRDGGEGKREEDARRKILEAIEDSYLDVTLKMRHPERVRLQWERRDEEEEGKL